MKYIHLGDIHFSSHWRKPLWAVATVWGFLATLIISICLWFIYSPIQVNDNVGIVNHSSKYFSVLDGAPVTSTGAQTPDAVAVMIDNFPSERGRQYGLANAAVVYEAPVEGELTRYMAVFDIERAPERVGPVRSARPYFLDWLSDYGRPLYMHSGGSPDALTEIKRRDINDVNEFYFGRYYWRDYNLSAPHNLFTGGELWYKLMPSFVTSTSFWEGRKFSDSAPAKAVIASSVAIKYHSNYEIKWEFKVHQGLYQRFVNGQVYSSNPTGDTIYARNVVIQYVNVRSLDEEDRKEITTVGSGSARVLRDGKMIYATWKKSDSASRTIFYDLDGQEILFGPGITWIQIVPREVVVEVAN